MSQPEQQQSQLGGKKAKKKKGTTISLNDFLGDAAPAAVTKSVDWADETEDLDGGVSDLTYQSSYNKQILSNLPTGPRSSRTIEVDMSKIPNEPPFTAFVGNLPYEADEEMLSDFFKDLKILSVRLPSENGRFKGYGYVEFADKHSLVEALQHNEETFNRRQIRVDVAGSKNQDNRRGNWNNFGGQSFGMGGGFDGPDVTEGDWRRKPEESYQAPSRDYQRSDSYGRDSRGGGYGRNDNGGYDDRDGYSRDRGGFGGDRGYGGDRGSYGGDRGYYDRNSYDRGYDRDRGYGGGSYGRDRNHDDGGYSGSGYGRENRYEGGNGSSGGYGDRYGGRDGDRRDRYQDDRRDGGYRDREDYGRRDDYGSRGPERRTSEESREEPQVRQSLKLKPRTKPIEQASSTVDSGSRMSIFGGAKPVDTAAREKEIEKKLKQEQDNVFRANDDRDAQPFKRAPRRSSERSDDGHHTSPRRIARRISSDKDYKDAQRRRSTSPGHQQDDSAGTKERPQKEYKPAPPPKQSAWGRRPANEEERGPRKTSASEEKSQPKKPLVRPAPAPVTNQWSRGPPKIENRGVREEAEGNSREDDLNERTPEGAVDNSRNGSGSSGDGSDQRRDGPPRRTDDKPRQYGDGRRDDRGRDHPYQKQQSHEEQSDFRRRGDGGSGRRRDYDQDRPSCGSYEGGRSSRPTQQGSGRRAGEEDRGVRGDPGRSKGQEKRRDSSRDSRPECDRSAAVGQEQDLQKGSGKTARRPARGPPVLEPDPVVEFVEKSQFSALAIEGDDDDVDEDVAETSAD